MFTTPANARFAAEFARLTELEVSAASLLCEIKEQKCNLLVDAGATPASRIARTPESTRFAVRFAACGHDNEMTPELRRALITALVTLTNNDDSKRYAITSYFFDRTSTKDLTGAMARALVDWIGCFKAGDRWVVSQAAADEAKAILRAVGTQRKAA